LFLRHNVKVYGTFIIENSTNEFFGRVFCRKNISAGSFSPSVGELAMYLDKIRRKMKFEGWLINMEIEFPEFYDELFAADSYFSHLLQSDIRYRYDAVTRKGKLNWQNALNAENVDFALAAEDGIFLNYNWNLDLLRLSQDTAGNSHWSKRIFVGVDCFGRGCPGGGGFNTSEAVNLILQASQSYPDRPLSVALFAPAWSFEKRNDIASVLPIACPTQNAVRAAQLISNLDSCFWQPLETLLSAIRACGRVPTTRGQHKHWYRPLTPLPCSEDAPVLRTNFGFGLGLFRISDDGPERKLKYEPWSCLNSQQSRPEYIDSYAQGNSLRVELSATTSYSTTNGHLNDLGTMTPQLHLELFLFPNLCLSREAELSLVLKPLPLSEPAIRGSVASVLDPLENLRLRLFVDLTVLPAAGPLYTSKSYPVTHRQFLLHESAIEMVVGQTPNWACIRYRLGQQLTSAQTTDSGATEADAEVVCVRRLGMQIPYQHDCAFLLGGLTLVDPDANWL
uniref:Mannosyl-glycoprotein endo-beta-N-acetylglucosaminidase n=1 Tax=Schistocephalus solidus TaxID=70667 RepID=A0A183SNU9_SCHSO